MTNELLVPLELIMQTAYILPLGIQYRQLLLYIQISSQNYFKAVDGNGYSVQATKLPNTLAKGIVWENFELRE